MLYIQWELDWDIYHDAMSRWSHLSKRYRNENRQAWMRTMEGTH